MAWLFQSKALLNITRLLKVKLFRSLDLQSYIHIWHGNTSRTAVTLCFMRCVIPYDVQTMEGLHYLRQQSLDVEKKHA